MPPRMVKKGVAASGPKRAPRTARGTPKAQNQPEVAEESLKAGEVSVSVAQTKEEVKVQEGVEEELVNKDAEPEPEPKAELKSEANGSIPMKKEDDAKESVDEYEKDERLELEDNEPEYEPEEYGAVDYDEKEIEQDDIQEDEGDEGEEEAEEDNIGEEEEGDMAEEEIEGVPEEEGEEDDEHVEDQDQDQDHAEEEEHHEVVQERRKRKEFEVFVGGLDKDATEADLRKVFGEVGEITEVRLMMNPQTKKNKGFAFLRFATVEQAKRAVIELKHPVVHGKQCGVTPSQDSDTLFLGNICRTWTKEALKEKLKHYGVENVEDLTLVEDGNNEGMNRGFAFLEFSSRSEAMDAFKRLQKRDVMFGVDRPAKVSFADSFVDPGDEIMAKVKTIFVDGVPASWDEDRLREALKTQGRIEKIELARNMSNAKRKDFAFVTFETHDTAVSCAKSINNSEIGEGDNKAKVRARLSRPLQGGKGKHAARGDTWHSRSVSRGVRSSWGRPTPRSFPVRGGRALGARPPPIGVRRTVSSRDRRPAMAAPPRGRPVHLSHSRRAPVPSYPKSSSLKRDYGRREDLPTSRSRAVPEYSRIAPERRPSFRGEYPRGSGYDIPRSSSRTVARRAFTDDGYSQRYERHPPSYREGRREYESVSGSKRPYSALDDVPPRYAEAGVRQSRARLDYELGGASQYGDAYSERLGRSNIGYGGSRSSISGQDSHGLYSSGRQGMGYGGGSYGSSDVGGMYSSSFSGDYMPRGSDVGGSSYSSLYSSRDVGGSSYMGSGGGSGPYY